jgi:cell division protein FtsW
MTKETPMSATANASPGEAPLLATPLRRDRSLSEPAILFFVIMSMMAIGVLMVYSASRKAYTAGDTWYFAKHMIFVPTALVAMYLGSRISYTRLNRRWVALGVLGLTVVMLAGVLLCGDLVNGARRWFSLGFGPVKVSLQPSELAKFTMVIFMAWFFAQPQGDPKHTASPSKFLGWFYRLLQSNPRSFWRGFLPAMLVVGLVGAMIAKEDFGTAALVGLVAVILCLVAGWRLWYSLLLIVPAVVGGYFFVWMVEYRRTRLDVWMDPWQYFSGKGWHVCQSLMGIGSGGLTGTGFGAGTQKLYIPENTTDFIFAVICEEMGMVGGLMVIGLLAVFVWRAGRIVKNAPDRFGFLLAAGIMLTISIQGILNIGVVTGALPAKGISLPFISYGGSGLVMMSFAAGLLMAVSRRTQALDLARASHPLVYAPPETPLWRVRPIQPATAADSTQTAVSDVSGVLAERVPLAACPPVPSEQHTGGQVASGTLARLTPGEIKTSPAAGSTEEPDGHA